MVLGGLLGRFWPKKKGEKKISAKNGKRRKRSKPLGMTLNGCNEWEKGRYHLFLFI
jgi:hypothetical protein